MLSAIECIHNKMPVLQLAIWMQSQMSLQELPESIWKTTSSSRKASCRYQKVEPHTYQKQSLKGIKTMKFMNQVNEPVKTGAFSIIETLLISAIIQNLYNSDWQVTIDEIDTLKIHSAYTSIREVAKAFNLQLPVHDRSLTEVARMCVLLPAISTI